MSDTTESTTDEANSTGDEQTVMLPESMVAYLYRGAVVGLAGLALIATVQFYLSASRAISIWIASDYEPFFQSAFNLVVTPIDLLVDASGSFVEAVIIEPLGIVETGASTSATAVGDQFGIFAFIVGIVVLLGGFFVIQRYLQDPDSSDIIPIPGVPDAPAIGPIDPGVTEEGEEEEDG